MKQPVIVAAALAVCLTSVAIAQPKPAGAATIHLRVGQTVYATESRSVGYAFCEAPEGVTPWQGGFQKPKLDANNVPKTLFSYRAGDALKVVTMHVFTWTYEGNRNSEKLWALETRDHHRFCLRDAQVDSTVVLKK